MSTTLGVDLAAQPKRTAACAVEWHASGAVVSVATLGVDDALLHNLAGSADKVGIDVPFGWPEAFVDALVAHRGHRKWPSVSALDLRFRRTDLYVQAETGKWPLSVSTDRIGITAFRAARFLDALNVDRRGTGRFVEVYPAAALRRWELPASIVELRRATEEWLEVPRELELLLAGSRDTFDALVASLVARASLRGLCDPIPEGDSQTLAKEGWIALPVTGSLAALV